VFIQPTFEKINTEISRYSILQISTTRYQE